jgi:hypothetical protein
MLNISVGDLVIPKNWPDKQISLDVEPDPNEETLGSLVPWRPGTGLGIIVQVIPVNGNFSSRWVKVFSPTAIGWCFSNELEIVG